MIPSMVRNSKTSFSQFFCKFPPNFFTSKWKMTFGHDNDHNSTWWFWFYALVVVYGMHPRLFFSFSFISFSSKFRFEFSMLPNTCDRTNTPKRLMFGKGKKWRWFTRVALFKHTLVQRVHSVVFVTLVVILYENSLFVRQFLMCRWSYKRMWCHALMMITNMGKFMHFFPACLNFFLSGFYCYCVQVHPKSEFQ